MSAGRFRLLGKLFDLPQVQSWWDHNFRQAGQALDSLEHSSTGAVLQAGRSGGQAIISTTANDQRLGIGAAPTQLLDVHVSTNAIAMARVLNDSTGTASESRLRASTSTVTAELAATSSGYTAFAYFGTTPASWAFCTSSTGNGLGVGTLNSAPLILGTNNVERARFDTLGNLILQTLGGGLRIKEGVNARMGVGVMAAGLLVVANTSVTANTRIFAFSNAVGVVGALANTARVVGTSFTITSAAAGDAGNVAWILYEPS